MIAVRPEFFLNERAFTFAPFAKWYLADFKFPFSQASD